MEKNLLLRRWRREYLYAVMVTVCLLSLVG
jgi:hypothetical protein